MDWVLEKDTTYEFYPQDAIERQDAPGIIIVDPDISKFVFNAVSNHDRLVFALNWVHTMIDSGWFNLLPSPDDEEYTVLQGGIKMMGEVLKAVSGVPMTDDSNEDHLRRSMTMQSEIESNGEED